MSMQEYLEKLKANGLLAEGVQAGVISVYAIRNMEIGIYFQSRMYSGRNRMDAYEDCSVQFGLSSDRIRQILSELGR